MRPVFLRRPGATPNSKSRAHSRIRKASGALRAALLLLILASAAAVLAFHVYSAPRVPLPEGILPLPKRILRYPPFAPIASCPNVFLFRTTAGGLGHRMAGLAIAITGAIRTGAAVLIDRHTLYEVERSIDDMTGYAFLEELFGLSAFRSINGSSISFAHPTAPVASPWGIALTPVDVGNGDVFRSEAAARAACGQLFAYDSGGPACAGKYCVFSMGGALDGAAGVLRVLYAAGAYSKRPVPAFLPAYNAAPRALTVAWHIRNGDYHANENVTFYMNLRRAVDAGLRGLPAKHFVFSQNAINDGVAAHGFGFLATDPAFIGTAFPSVAPMADDFNHLVRADVLVHSGSSWSYAATLVSPASQVRLFCPPKEVAMGFPVAHDFYWVNGSIPVNADGTVSVEHAEALAQLLQARYHEVTALALARRGRLLRAW